MNLYYDMPFPLERQEEFPSHFPITDWVGVYVSEDGRSAYSVKKAKRRPVENPDTLKDSMIRSLNREVTKQVQSGDPLRVERLNREISRLKQERGYYYRQYWDLLREVQKRYGTHWDKGGNKL